MLAETHSVFKTEHHAARTTGPGATNILDTPKLRAACENCRQSKVKCNLSVSGGKEAPSSSPSSSSACIRCLRHGLTCRYRVANRSGKPKGSKNRATLRKLGQLQLQQQQQQQQQNQHPEERKPMISRGDGGPGGGGNLHGGWNYIEPFVSSQPPSVVDGILEEPSPQDTSQPSHSNSPDSQGVSMTDVSSLLDESCAAAQHLGYHPHPHPSCMGGPPPGGYVPPPPPPQLSIFDQTTTTTTTATSSMSPIFLQKEFITKGITSCPLAVHMQPTCDCGDALVFHMNRLRSVTTMVHHPRFDLLLQAIATALATCRIFLQCPGCPKDGTHLLYAASIVDFTVQLFDFAIPYELSLTGTTTTTAAAAAAAAASTTTSTSPANDPGVLVGYGEYEIALDETRRIRRFLLRGRLLQCREVVSLLQETTEVSRQELFIRGGGGGSGSPGATATGAADLTAAFENGDLILQILAGHDATVEAFLQAMAGGGCMCCCGCCERHHRT